MKLSLLTASFIVIGEHLAKVKLPHRKAKYVNRLYVQTKNPVIQILKNSTDTPKIIITG